MPSPEETKDLTMPVVTGINVLFNGKEMIPKRDPNDRGYNNNSVSSSASMSLAIPPHFTPEQVSELYDKVWIALGRKVAMWNQAYAAGFQNGMLRMEQEMNHLLDRMGREESRFF